MTHKEATAVAIIGLATVGPHLFFGMVRKLSGDEPAWLNSLGWFIAYGLAPWIFLLFPPFVAAVAGRRALFYGVIAVLVPVLVGTALSWNPEQYPGGRWNWFWHEDVPMLLTIAGLALLTSLPVYPAQRRKPS